MLIFGVAAPRANRRHVDGDRDRYSAGPLTANTSPSFSVNAGAFTKLQLLMPGETASPGSASGKTGTPTLKAPGRRSTLRLMPSTPIGISSIPSPTLSESLRAMAMQLCPPTPP